MTAWQSAFRKVTQTLAPDIFIGPQITPKEVDWDRLVSIDFETYYDQDYTLSKLSTSEYVRDPRFKAQMMYLKVGRKPAKIVPPNRIKAELRKINWATHALLCHHTQFDGLILSHHYGVVPSYYYDTLSMARALHTNEIGAGLNEVSVFYGGQGKLEGVLEETRGVRDWSPALFKQTAPYCLNDGDEMLRVFECMLPKMPDSEMDLINLVVRMFCDPVLVVNLPRVQAELERELKRREALMETIIDVSVYEPVIKEILKTKAERALTGKERHELIVKRVIGSNERFADLLRSAGVDPPVKLSPAWMKKPSSERTEADKWIYAFGKDDLDFIGLPDSPKRWTESFDLDTTDGLKAHIARQERLQHLVDTRIAVKSTTNITRAERFLTAGANGMRLPVYYAFSRAVTHRLGGGDKRNMQNLTRGGELRKSIEAAPGHVLVVGDSGQIEARTNGWLWGQQDLMVAFREADTGLGLDAYCRFASKIYARVITKTDKTERFVGKVCVLGLGFGMGPLKLQLTLAKGALGGPPVYFTLDQCNIIVNTYRRVNHAIHKGWGICNRIIEDMAAGRTGRHGPLEWEANTVWLPNGLALKYPDLRYTVDEDDGTGAWTYQSGDVRKKIYGALLCENIVQALARIIVMDQMLELSRSVRIVMTTHDEIVAMPRKAAAELTARRMHKIMTTPPEWAPDIPLASEVDYAVEYSK